MRNKIIAVNALIMLVVGVVSFLLIRTLLTSAATNPEQIASEGRRDALGYAARMQVEAAAGEHWLATKATEGATLQDFRAPAKDPESRADMASSRADALARDHAPKQLTLIALVSEKGVILGRNNGKDMRGEDLSKLLPGLPTAIATGRTGSDMWFDHDHQFLASYVGIRDDQSGRALGGIVIGRPVSDLLASIDERVVPMALVLQGAGDELPIVGRAGQKGSVEDSALGHALTTPGDPTREMIKATVRDASAGRSGDTLIAAAALGEIATEGRRPVLVLAEPATLLENASSMATPILGVMGLGLVLVVIGGWLLGNYISRPINTLEEGLLAILNGQADRRFELDHAELGGLAFRIDQLLNQLMGVEEDTTDAEGRASKPPSAAHFTDAMSVDDKRMEGEGTLDPDAVAHLASEASSAYYGRIYREYIAAKKTLGEATDHITEQAFATRIQAMEKEASEKYGRPVRYQVQARAKEVVLLAIPLP